MAASAKHSLALNEREQFLRPDSTSPLISLCHALEGRIAIEIGDLDRATRCAQSLQPGNRASLLRGSDRARPKASQIAPTMRSLDARRQRCASASTSRCFPPGSRTSGNLTPQIRGSRRRSLSRRSKASSWPSPTTSWSSDRASLCSYGPDASSNTSRPCSTASNATRPSRTRTAARRDRSAAANSLSFAISRPDSRTKKSRRSSSSRPTRSRHTSSGSTKSSGFRLAREAVTEARRLGLF